MELHNQASDLTMPDVNLFLRGPLVIEVFVYPENWPDHLLWSGCLLYVIARGPGELSFDALVRRSVDPRA